MAFNIITLSTMTFKKMTFTIMTFSMRILSITVSYNDLDQCLDICSYVTFFKLLSIEALMLLAHFN